MLVQGWKEKWVGRRCRDGLRHRDLRRIHLPEPPAAGFSATKVEGRSCTQLRRDSDEPGTAKPQAAQRASLEQLVVERAPQDSRWACGTPGKPSLLWGRDNAFLAASEHAGQERACPERKQPEPCRKE